MSVVISPTFGAGAMGFSSSPFHHVVGTCPPVSGWQIPNARQQDGQ